MNRKAGFVLLCAASMACMTPVPADEQPNESIEQAASYPLQLLWTDQTVSSGCPAGTNHCGYTTYICNSFAPQKSFMDPTPVGSVVKSVRVSLLGTCLQGRNYTVSLNGTTIGVVTGTGFCDCNCYPLDVFQTWDAGVPSYVYGGTNTLRVLTNPQTVTPCLYSASVTLTTLDRVVDAGPPVNFGTRLVGSNTPTRNVVLTATGDDPITINSATASPAVFSRSGPTLPVTLLKGQQATFVVTYAPLDAGTHTGSLSFLTNGPTPQPSVPLTGSAVGFGSESVIDHGTVAVGASSERVLTLTNTSPTDAVTVSMISVGGLAGADHFADAGPLPISIGPNGTHPVAVSFVPSDAGVRAATLTVTNDSPWPQWVATLTGIGLPPDAGAGGGTAGGGAAGGGAAGGGAAGGGAAGGATAGGGAAGGATAGSATARAARLRAARLRAARLQAARLRAARLRAARLQAARLRAARLRAVRLRAAAEEAK